MRLPKSRNALTALCLLVPASTMGVLCGMIWFPDTALGAGLFFFFKAWLLILPLVWRLWIDKQPVRFSLSHNGGTLAGILTGLLIAGVILTFWKLLGPHLVDPELVRTKMIAVGLTTLPRYLGMIVYWILINSLLEEVVWRWFVTEKFNIICRSHLPAALLSALAFTIHHFIAMLTFFSLPAALLCSFFIFVGGTIWSALYLRTNSIHSPYISHIFADIAIFLIGGLILFA